MSEESKFIKQIKKQENDKNKGLENDKWYQYKSIEGGNDTIAWGHKLTDHEQKNKIFANGITQAQANDLLKGDINRHQDRARRDYDSKYGKGNFDNLKQYQKEVATDIVYTVGNLESYPNFMKAMKDDNKDLMMKNCTGTYTDRDGVVHPLTNRNEFRQNLIRDNYGKSSQNQVGGVDFSMKNIPILDGNLESLNILGLSLDSNNCNFIINENLMEYGININDLAVALMVFYNNEIACKNISFSLDPWELQNPKGPFQRKVYWPDTEENNTIIADTEYGDVLFECDYIMKQLSLDMDCNNSWKISQKLRQLGLKPIYELEKSNQDTWMRLWLLIENVTAVRKNCLNADEKYFNVLDAKIRVDARIMEIGSDGKLKDKTVHNENNPATFFAKRFTQLYDEIAKEFPVFNRLKQIAKANTLAKWMWLNRIPVDLNKVEELVRKNRKFGIEYRVRSLSKKTNYSSSVFGGANANIKSNYSLLEWQTRQFYAENSSDEDTQVSIEETISNMPNTGLFMFSFEPEKYCSVCQYKLSSTEISYCKKDMFCRIHNPDLCNACLKPLFREFLKVNEEGYHKECFLCNICFISLKSSFTRYKDFYAHMSCIQDKESKKMHSKTRIYQLAAKLETILEYKFTFKQCRKALKLFECDEVEAINYLLTAPNSNKKEKGTEVDMSQSFITEECFMSQLAQSDSEAIEKLWIEGGLDINEITDVYLACNKDIDITRAVLKSRYDF